MELNPGAPGAPGAQPATRQEYVAAAINEAIVSGRLKPGQRILVDDLAHQLGVSRIPVREALHALEGQGEVVRRPRGGFSVPDLSLEDFEDANHWREILEEHAYPLACDHITSDDIHTLDLLLHQMSSAIEKSDWYAFARLNREFHLIPIRAIGSQRLDQMVTHLWNAFDRYYGAVVRGSDDLFTLQEEHREILTALRERNQAAIADVMRRHRVSGFERTRRMLIRTGPSRPPRSAGGPGHSRSPSSPPS